MRTTVASAISIALAAWVAATPASAASLVTVQQGGVGRWTGIAAKECGIYGKRYAAVDAVCYYPVDIRAKPGAHAINLWDQDGKLHKGTLRVEKTDFPEVQMTLPDSLDRFLHVASDDLARAKADRAATAKILGGTLDAPSFSLPLAAPTASLPKSEDDFGSLRVFDPQHRSLHSGRDYPVPEGNAVKAVADGTVVLAADQFFSGNSVYVDHGDGLLSMNFHLSSIAVKDGEVVKRGQTLGKIGATGRATGPHLHLGVRWLGKRVDPALLLATPDALPSVADTPQEAQRKIDKAETREPPETDDIDDEG
ncbi:M23 family metallopeptidase [Dokdonella sp.]|uniref:M23 family metallopeptidase n=1 Tax=Dokdonella sp. TaxID=2291710 RepID=UPI0037848D1F